MLRRRKAARRRAELARMTRSQLIALHGRLITEGRGVRHAVAPTDIHRWGRSEIIPAILHLEALL